MNPAGRPFPAVAPMTVLGIMSGTSVDSVDYALCVISADGVTLKRLWSAAFPSALQKRLHAAARNDARCWEVAQWHHDLGRFYAQEARRGLGRHRVNLVGLHGQTVFHNPDAETPATLQIGEASWIAETLCVPVVSNFRAADLAAGGQGAPLATVFHQAVFASPGQHVCVHNLGGISNVTSLDHRRPRTPRVLAFDTGPANMLMDLAARQVSGGRATCDRDGAWAAAGTPCEPLLRKWLKLPFLSAPPPKSTGREQFGEPFFQGAWTEMRQRGLSCDAILATFTEFTARSIALNYQLHLPHPIHRVILTGGGAANGHLVRRLRSLLSGLSPGVDVTTGEFLGWPLQAIEPAAFALLAWRRWHGLAGNLPSTTGARHPVLSGQITEPFAALSS